MSEFRATNFLTKNSLPMRYINKNFLKCPFCGDAPKWTFRGAGILAMRHQFRCESCKAVISTPIQEFTSPLSNTNITWYGAAKKMEGKSLEPYFRVEDGGIHERNWKFVSKEYTVNQLKQLNR